MRSVLSTGERSIDCGAQIFYFRFGEIFFSNEKANLDFICIHLNLALAGSNDQISFVKGKKC